MQIKGQLSNLNKSNQTLTEYMQNIKSRANELVIMNAPVNNEDPTIKILNGLRDEFKDLEVAIQA